MADRAGPPDQVLPVLADFRLTCAAVQAQCLKDWRLAWISGGGWVCG